MFEHRALTDHLAVTTERERVARDVHDVLGHSLTVITVKAELAERLVDTDPERAKAELAQIRDLTRQSLAEIRATVGGLRVARLTDQISSAHRPGRRRHPQRALRRPAGGRPLTGRAGVGAWEAVAGVGGERRLTAG